MRVISLVPSATEILCQIGGTDLLVGRSHECDHPDGVGDLPILTTQTTRMDPDCGVGEQEIDRQVRETIEAGDSLYRLDTARLAELEPDLILTQDLCSVCSVDGASVREVAASLTKPPKILSLNPQGIEDVLDDHLRVGEAVGLESQATDAVVRLQDRLLRAQEYANPYAEPVRVLFLEWTEPMFAAGHWTVQMIERAGGAHPWNPSVAKQGAGDAAGLLQSERLAPAARVIEADELVGEDLWAIVVAPCGLALPEAVRSAERLMEQPWVKRTTAYRDGRIAAVDGNEMFNRPGPRLVEAFEWLVGWLNDRPNLIPTGFPWRAMGPRERSAD